MHFILYKSLARHKFPREYNERKEVSMKNFQLILSCTLLLIMAGCATSAVANFESVVKKRASFDFNCPENYVSVIAEGITRYAAQGCGKKGVYEVKCSLGPCIATQVE
jgi:hypothetical protein